jgi:hypothetical protein
LSNTLKHAEKTQQQNVTQTEEKQHDDATMNCNKTKTKTTAQTTNDQQSQKGMATTNKTWMTTTGSKNTEPTQEQRQDSR